MNEADMAKGEALANLESAEMQRFEAEEVQKLATEETVMALNAKRKAEAALAKCKSQ